MYRNIKHQKDRNQLNDTEVRRKLLIMKVHLLSRKLAAREEKKNQLCLAEREILTN